jgi:hypothetical protein
MTAKCKLKNEKCKMKKTEAIEVEALLGCSQFAFFILHFTICIPTLGETLP